MALDFDTLSDRVAAAAAGVQALGYLNWLGGSTYEVRLQMRPPTTVWDERPMGYSQKFFSAEAVVKYLEVLEGAAADRRLAIESGDPEALTAVLAAAEDSLRKATG